MTRVCSHAFAKFAVALWLGTLSCWAELYQVGPQRTWHSLAALPELVAGDIVAIDPGTYHEVKRWTRSGSATLPITVRGVGEVRPVFDATGLNVSGSLPNPRAIFQIEGDHIVVENLEFRNARNGDNGAGIRISGASDVTVRNCRITQCDMGVMSDHNRGLLIESSEVASNGTPLYDGYSHNFYLGGNDATIRFCSIHDALFGQNFKTRAHYTELLYNFIADSQDGEVGMVDADETGAVDSHALLLGNIIVSKPRQAGYNSGRFIQFGQDSGLPHRGTLFAFNNTCVAGDGRIRFLDVTSPEAAVVAHNNIFFGSDRVVGLAGAGISGSNNWVQSTATGTASFQGSVGGKNPGFRDVAVRDFRLLPNSACRHRGLERMTFLDGAGASHLTSPEYQYVSPGAGRSRSNTSGVDLGALANSVVLINGIRLRGSSCAVSLLANRGDRYDLERIGDLANRVWNPVITGIAPADGLFELIDTEISSRPRQFYRVISAL